MFSAANLIARNRHNNEELELFSSLNCMKYTVAEELVVLVFIRLFKQFATIVNTLLK